MVALDAGVDMEEVDEHFLDNTVITKEGIEIVLNRGAYLPMSEGVKTVFFKYDEIEKLLIESFDYKNNKSEIKENDILLNDKEEQHSIDPDKPMIALTFDDGPSAHTERLLDIFKKNGGKGTFLLLVIC